MMSMVSLNEYAFLWAAGLVAVVIGVIAGIGATIRDRRDRK